MAVPQQGLPLSLSFCVLAKTLSRPSLRKALQLYLQDYPLHYPSPPLILCVMGAAMTKPRTHSARHSLQMKVAVLLDEANEILADMCERLVKGFLSGS